MAIIGICRLTGEEGPFVKSHIIPKALAPPRPKGDAFAQIGDRHRPTRRRDSWYDAKLVTRRGEDILTAYDTWGIAELRRLKLIWQSWNSAQSLSAPDFLPIPGTSNGMRRVRFSDPGRMRLFLLSILWRAAETDLREFNEVTLRASDKRRLRQHLVAGVCPPDDCFPITLTQITTIGVPHNLTPLRQQVRVRAIKGSAVNLRQIYRFYFDGLITHFTLNPNARTMDALHPMLVGPPEGTTLSTVTFDRSFQLQNLRDVLADSELEFPGLRARAEGGQRPS